MSNRIKVLLVEDDEDTAFFEKAALLNYKDIKFEVTHALSLKESLKIIGKKFFDVILLDLMLPNGAGLEVFNTIHNKCATVPIVIISGYEEHAIEAVQAGAQDYLVKPVNIGQLVTSINYAIERKKVEYQCLEDYKMLLNIFDNMEEMIYILDPNSYEILYMNESIKKAFGCSVGKKCYTIFDNFESPCLNCHNKEIFGDNVGKTFIYEIKSGKNNKWYKSTIRALKCLDGRLLRYTIAVDITETKNKEKELNNFIEKKLIEFNNKMTKSSSHYKTQVDRLEKLTLDMVAVDEVI